MQPPVPSPVPPLPPAWRVGLLTLIVVGLLLRFVNLETKLFWQDESAVALYEAGYGITELESLFGDAGELQPPAIRRLMLMTPGRGFSDTLRSLAEDNPQIAPLYPLLARAWRLAVGDSVGRLRALSALLSGLAVIGLAGLTVELTGDRRAAWLAAALAAVAPFHQVYAQEAREYSLWALWTCLASWALLRALRLRRPAAWALYAASAAVGLYTHLFSGLVLLAHTVYVVGVGQVGRSVEPAARRDLAAFAAASAFGLLTFAPWLAVIAQHWPRLSEQTHWTAGPLPRLNLAAEWLIDLCHLLVDQPNQVGGSEMSLFRLIAGYLAACLLGYSLVWTVETAPRRVWPFVLSLTLVPWLPLVAVDLLRGGVLSTTERYLTPSYLGLELALALLAAHTWGEPRRSARVWSLLIGLLLLWGVVGDMRLTQIRFVRSKGDNAALLAAAEVVNPQRQPLLLVNRWRTAPYTWLVMGRLFDDDTRFRLVADDSPSLLPDAAEPGPVYLLNPSPALLQRLTDLGEPVVAHDGADLVQVR